MLEHWLEEDSCDMPWTGLASPGRPAQSRSNRLWHYRVVEALGERHVPSTLLDRLRSVTVIKVGLWAVTAVRTLFFAPTSSSNRTPTFSRRNGYLPVAEAGQDNGGQIPPILVEPHMC